jgi:hypothetical protein
MVSQRKVPELIPETEEEKRLFDGALRRRQVRLILAGKMKPNDALELKAFLIQTIISLQTQNTTQQKLL